jgi:hypothetical protein
MVVHTDGIETIANYAPDQEEAYKKQPETKKPELKGLALDNQRLEAVIQKNREKVKLTGNYNCRGELVLYNK